MSPKSPGFNTPSNISSTKASPHLADTKKTSSEHYTSGENIARRESTGSENSSSIVLSPPRPSSLPPHGTSAIELISKAATFVPPHTVSRHDVGSGYKRNQPSSLLVVERPVVGTEGSANWSGFELRGNAGSYSWAEGLWTVPDVSSFGEVGVQTYSSLWVGLDGDGTTDLVQAGTAQQSVAFEIPILGQLVPFDFASYWAWTEFLPQQPTMQQVSSVPVAVGDEVFVYVVVGDGLLSPNLNGSDGIFWIQNDTTGLYTFVRTPRGTTNVVGSEAVWIMERPTIYPNGIPTYATLADYGAATLSAAYAGTDTTNIAYGNGPEIQITMTNGPDVLSTVTPLSSTSMQFNWKAYK
jgi:hypothetical protein